MSMICSNFENGMHDMNHVPEIENLLQHRGIEANQNIHKNNFKRCKKQYIRFLFYFSEYQ